MKPIELIRSEFLKEFLCMKEKFEIIILKISEAKTTRVDFIYHPGVYIFWNDNRIIKVGRHLTNSRKRALEHIRDNTSNSDFEMKSLSKGNESSGLVLINCKNIEDYHWVAAIEIYLEKKLKPVIKSGRTG